MASMMIPSGARLLRDEAEYNAVVEEMEALLDAEPAPGSKEEERIRFLAFLVYAFDDERSPVEATTPQEVVDFMLEQQGRERADLAELMGGKSRVSEFFAGKRELSINQVRTLREQLGVPADLLISRNATSQPVRRRSSDQRRKRSSKHVTRTSTRTGSTVRKDSINRGKPGRGKRPAA